MGMTGHSLWALKSPPQMILAEGWWIWALSILLDTASTTEQDGEEGEDDEGKGRICGGMQQSPSET